MWDMRRKGQVVRSRTDYILGMDSCLFNSVAVRDRTTCPFLRMSHIRLSLHHRLPRGMKCCAMSSNPAVAMSVAMFSARRSPSGAAMSALKSPATISSAPRGFFPIAATTLSIVSSSSGAMYAPTMYHRRSPVAN